MPDFAIVTARTRVDVTTANRGGLNHDRTVYYVVDVRQPLEAANEASSESPDANDAARRFGWVDSIHATLPQAIARYTELTGEAY